MRSIAASVIFVAVSLLPMTAFAQSQRGAPADGAAASAARIERLEEQLVELRGVVAALETLAKTNGGGGAGYAAAAGGGASSEQIRQLTEQVAELNRRLQRLESRSGSNTGPGADESRTQTGFNTVAPASGFEDKQQLPPLSSPQAESDRYGSSQIANASQPRPYGADSAAAAPKPVPTAAQPPASTPKALLDQAYGALGRRDYSTAESYFQQFLDQYPNDLMAGSAQYGSGEAAFQSGEYRNAADRFLKTFTNFPRSDKAPEALLKLAISLHRLGENAAACDSFAELQRRYPQSPKCVLQRADVEKKRANCS